jgi:hypothetical protein
VCCACTHTNTGCLRQFRLAAKEGCAGRREGSLQRGPAQHTAQLLYSRFSDTLPLTPSLCPAAAAAAAAVLQATARVASPSGVASLKMSSDPRCGTTGPAFCPWQTQVCAAAAAAATQCVLWLVDTLHCDRVLGGLLDSGGPERSREESAAPVAVQ